MGGRCSWELIPASPILPGDGSRKVRVASSAAPLPFISPFPAKFPGVGLWFADTSYGSPTSHQVDFSFVFQKLPQMKSRFTLQHHFISSDFVSQFPLAGLSMVISDGLDF